MKVNPILFIVLMIAFFTIGCKKDKSDVTKIIGKVKDYTTDDLIKDAIIVLSIDTIDNWMGLTYNPIASTISDDKGEFLFEYKTIPGAGYDIIVFKDNYLNSKFYHVKKPNEENYIITYIKPMAYLKLHIKNTVPYDELDRITVRLESKYCPQNEFVGTMIDTTLVFCPPLYGNLSNKIDWYIVKNNINSEGTTNIYYPAFDTVFYEINY